MFFASRGIFKNIHFSKYVFRRILTQILLEMKIRSNIALSETGFVFNPNTGESFTLNDMGMEIFDMLKKEKEAEEILQAIIEKYDIDRDLAEKDLDDFMHDLTTYQIIETDE